MLIADAWVRLVETCITSEVNVLARPLAPLQMAVGMPSGAEDVVHLARAALINEPTFIMVKTDIKNAFGSVNRSAIFAAINNLCPVQHSNMLRWYANTHMRSSTTYLASDGTVHSYNQGVAQGSPLSMFLFCASIQQALVDTKKFVDTTFEDDNSIIVSYADDATFIGPVATAFAAAQHFGELIAPLGLTLQPHKSTVMATTDATCIAAGVLAGDANFPAPVTHTDLLGAPVGNVDAESTQLLDLIDPAIFSRLDMMHDPQSQLLLLRHCIITKFNYYARCCPPDSSKEALSTLNKLVGASLCNIVGTQNVTEHAWHSARMPLSFGGLGLTHLYRIRHAAYYASATHALQTWAQHLGTQHPIIAAWANPDSQMGVHLTRTQDAVKQMILEYNTSKIVPEHINAPADADKADPECLITTPAPPAIPNSIKQLLHSKSDEARAHKLQRELTHIDAVITYRTCWRDIGMQDLTTRAQFLANATPSSSIWLQLTPENKKFKMEEKEFRINLMQHLHLDEELERFLGLPTDAPIPCICAANSEFNSNIDGDDDAPTAQFTKKNPRATFSHMLNCTHEQAFTHRHNALVQVVADAARSIGLTPVIEHPVSIPAPHTGNHEQRLQPMRFDVTIGGISSDTKILQCDVSVCSHRCDDKVYLTGGSRKPLYAANK